MSDRDEHFIGWLPMPAGFRRFLGPVGIGLLIALPVVALVAAGAQRPPSSGQWDDTTVTVEGVLVADPYAMLLVPGEEGDRTVLLVEEGKFGAADRAREFTGRAVRVTGTRLHREDREMVELAAGPEGVQPLVAEPVWAERLRAIRPNIVGPVTLRGEVVDSKCFLGAMRPGNGKTHRACAARCIAGGIPPMLVTTVDGRAEFYLLTTADGRPAADSVIDVVGDSIEVRGVVEEMAEMKWLRLEGIRRHQPGARATAVARAPGWSERLLTVSASARTAAAATEWPGPRPTASRP
jgi:hypothetical protein